MSNTKNLEFHPRFDNVYYLDDHGAIIWLIVGSEKALIIDTAYGTADIQTAARKITNHPLILVNTHVHFDHAAGNAQFEQVHVHEKDIFLFEKTKRALKDKFQIPQTIIPIQDGHIFDLGDTQIKTIHLPGHTPGSIGFLYPQERAFFCGDAISPEMWVHLGHSTSLEVFKRSMQKIIARQSEFDTIYISHGKMGRAYKIELPQKLENMANQIILGEKIGKPMQDQYGQPAHYILEDGIKFLYNPNRLTGERK